MTEPERYVEELIKILAAYEGKKILISCQGQAMDGYTALANFVDLARRARDSGGIDNDRS